MFAPFDFKRVLATNPEQRTLSETEELAKWLRCLRYRFLAKLSEDGLRSLAAEATLLTLPADSVVYRQGEIGNRCFLIQIGRAHV